MANVVSIATLSCLLTLSAGLPAQIDSQAPRTSAECRSLKGYKFYYDHGTDHCEQCREICVYAEVMGTMEQCRRECQAFLNAMKCEDKTDQFYDEALDICSPCSELCDDHQAKGSTQQCEARCSDYMKRLTPEQVPSHHKQNYLKAVDGSDSQTAGMQLRLHPGWIAAIVVGSVAILCFLAVVAILFKTCNTQYVPAPQQEPAVRPRDTPRPVEETSQGSNSPHFAIDASAAPHTAFSDMMDNGNQGEIV